MMTIGPVDNSPKRRYKWPWVLLAAVVLFIALAILWMSFAVKQVEQERSGSAPVHAAGN